MLFNVYDCYSATGRIGGVCKSSFLNNVKYLKNNLIDSSGPTGSCSEWGDWSYDVKI